MKTLLSSFRRVLLVFACAAVLGAPLLRAVNHNPAPQGDEIDGLSTDVTISDAVAVADGENMVEVTVTVDAGEHPELLAEGGQTPFIIVLKHDVTGADADPDEVLATLEITEGGTYTLEPFEGNDCGCSIYVKVAGLEYQHQAVETPAETLKVTPAEANGEDSPDLPPPTEGGGSAGGPEIKMNLGGSEKTTSSAFGKGAGMLRMATDKPGAELYEQGSLQMLGASGAATPITAVVGGKTVLRQVVSATQLTDIVPGDTFEGYTLKVYPLSAKGTADGSGVFAISGSPLRTVKVENPGSTGTATGLKVTTQDGSEPIKVSNYTWTTDSTTGRINDVTLAKPGSLGKKSRKVEWATDRSSYQEINETLTSSNVLVSKHVATYEKVGNNYVLTKTQQYYSVSADPLESRLDYYLGNPADGLATARLKWRKDPAGYWESYTYDAKGRLSKTVSQYLNSTFEDEANSKVQTVAYSTSNPTETHITKIKGQEVARSYVAKFDSADEFETRYVTCQTPGAAWTASDNLISATRTYKSSHGTAMNRGQTKWSRSANGTMTLYTYAKVGATKVTTVERGAPDAAFPPADVEATDPLAPDVYTIIAGSREISTANGFGQQIEAETIDIASGLTLSTWTAATVDSLGRPTLISHGDGTSSSTTYIGSSASCGSCSGAGNFLVESETDRNGVTTTYAYDSLNRRIETTRLGIKEQVVYDAAGRVIETHRIGTDTSDIRTSKTVYDLAGRVIATHDALDADLENGTTTTYVYPTGGGITTTTTNPAATSGAVRGTRIETTHADGRTKEISGTAVSPVKYAYGTWTGTGVAGEWTQEIKVGESASETEWIKSYSDFVGRAVKQEYPAASGTVAATMTYNAFGQLIRQTDPDGVQTLFAYNAEGEREVAAIDLDQDNVIDYTGTDRITQTTRDVYSRSGTIVSRSTTQVWATDGSNTATTVSVTEQDGYGNQRWQTDAAGAVTTSAIDRDSAGVWRIISTAPDGSQQVQAYSDGFLVSTVQKNGAGGQVTKVEYAYDEHNRVEIQTDARTGAISYTYTDRDEVLTVIANNGTETTTYAYDALGNQLTITRPDASVTTNEYYLRNNQLKKVSGSLTYPVEYTYDPQGRMKTLTTWQNATTSAGAAVTTWDYDSQRGWLMQKLYADNTGPAYTYTDAGRLLTRTWVRTVSSSPLVTTYDYNTAGDLVSTDYSDTTTDVAITYNRFGAQSTVTDTTGTRAFTYNAALRPTQEQLPVFYGDRILTRTYQVGLDLVSTPSSVPGRTSGFQIGVTDDLDPLTTNDLAVDYAVTYAYDNAGRLGTVTDPSSTYTYAYQTNSYLRSTLTGPVHTATTTYEANRNVIASLENKVGATTISKYEYTVNNLGQRTTRANTGTAFGTASTDNFTYNAKGEVTAATNATLTSRDQGFGYDDIGNRLTFTQTSGTTSYTANNLNAYTAIGAASPTHDQDGNQTSTGTGQVYTWDAENRLIAIEPVSPTTGDKKQLNAYDAQSRRVRKQVSTYASGTWSLTSDEKFIYDGWNVVAVLNAASSNALLRTYTWGTDLSGSMQGAGGVGGLLSTKDGGSVYHYTYDANGNVSEVLNNSGGIAAHYEYDTFGNIIASSGAYATTNAYRFSTKLLDSVSELYYYGYRYYDSGTGRWLSRDPIDERGGVVLYGFVGNGPVNNVDILGLKSAGWKTWVPGLIIAIAGEAAELALSEIPNNTRCKSTCIAACDAATAVGVVSILAAASYSLSSCAGMWWNPPAGVACVLGMTTLKVMALSNLRNDQDGCMQGCRSKP